VHVNIDDRPARLGGRGFKSTRRKDEPGSAAAAEKVSAL
jgi:hypothetical protein